MMLFNYLCWITRRQTIHFSGSHVRTQVVDPWIPMTAMPHLFRLATQIDATHFLTNCDSDPSRKLWSSNGCGLERHGEEETLSFQVWKLGVSQENDSGGTSNFSIFTWAPLLDRTCHSSLGSPTWRQSKVAAHLKGSRAKCQPFYERQYFSLPSGNST